MSAPLSRVPSPVREEVDEVCDTSEVCEWLAPLRGLPVTRGTETDDPYGGVPASGVFFSGRRLGWETFGVD